MSPGVNMAAPEYSDISNLFLGSVVEELLSQFLDESSYVYETNRRSDTSGSISGDSLPASSYGDGSLFAGSRGRLPAEDYQKCSRNGSRSQSTIGNPIHARKAHRPTKHERQSRVQVVRSTEKALNAELRELLRPTLGDDKWSNTTAGMLEKAIEFIRDEEERLGEDGERPAAVGRGDVQLTKPLPKIHDKPVAYTALSLYQGLEQLSSTTLAIPPDADEVHGVPMPYAIAAIREQPDIKYALEAAKIMFTQWKGVEVVFKFINHRTMQYEAMRAFKRPIIIRNTDIIGVHSMMVPFDPREGVFVPGVYAAEFEPVALDSFEDAGRYVVAFNEQERAKYALEEAARKREEEVEEAIAWRDVYQYMAAFGLPKSKESLQRCLPHPTTESATLQSRTAFEESRIRAERASMRISSLAQNNDSVNDLDDIFPFDEVLQSLAIEPTQPSGGQPIGMDGRPLQASVSNGGVHEPDRTPPSRPESAYSPYSGSDLPAESINGQECFIPGYAPLSPTEATSVALKAAQLDQEILSHSASVFSSTVNQCHSAMLQQKQRNLPFDTSSTSPRS